MSTMSPEKLNSTLHSIHHDDDIDMTWHDPPSSPFVSHVDNEDQENEGPADDISGSPVSSQGSTMSLDGPPARHLSQVSSTKQRIREVSKKLLEQHETEKHGKIWKSREVRG